MLMAAATAVGQVTGHKPTEQEMVDLAKATDSVVAPGAEDVPRREHRVGCVHQSCCGADGKVFQRHRCVRPIRTSGNQIGPRPQTTASAR